MPRKQKKYHYIYKTTNVINGKYYIGMHSTDNLNDGYMGSGKRLWNSIKYHGKENHVCEILEYCKDRKELIKREGEIVNEQLLNEDLCMNLRTGGTGGVRDEEHMMKAVKAAAKSTNQKRWVDNRDENIKKQSDKFKKYWEEGKFIKVGKEINDFTGKKHSKETKKKISESLKGQGSGSNNSQFGSCWITNEKENKKIMRGDLIPEGWRLGRKMKTQK